MIKLYQLIFLLICLVILGNEAGFAQARSITGKVLDEQGTGIPGVSILVKGTTTGTISDVEGAFSLNLPENAQTLVFSAVGYKAQEQPVDGRSDYSIKLATNVEQLNEIVVIGYGEVTKSDVTSSIASVTAKDIQNLPLAGVDQALQGKVAGVTITSNGGQPGGGISVRVRGITSVNGNEPLYVVDGTPLQGNRNSISQDQLGGQAGQNVQSPLAAINPNDIESIEVLKDASAQAIYGARAANGVVLIKTKSGKAGESKMTYDVYYGVQVRPKKLKLMNLNQFASYQNSLVPEIRASGSGNLDTLGEFKDPSVLGAGTDWQDEIFQQGMIQNHQLSFSGAQNKTSYYFSFNYFNQSGIVIGSKFDRFSTRIGIDQQVKSWLKAGISINASKANQRITLTDGSDAVISLAVFNSPASPVRGLDGQFASVSNIGGSQFGNPNNPVAIATQRDVRAIQYKAFGNIYADISILKSLVLRNELNYDFNLAQNSAFQPNIVNSNTGATILSPSRLIEDRGTGLFWALKTYLTFDKSFKKHYVNVVVGHESNESKFDQITATRINLTQNLQSLNAGSATNQQINAGKYPWALESYFARAVYTFDSKYSITASYRTDGSAAFGPNKKWGTFSAVSLGWTISQENFLKDSKFVNYLKIRGSVGTVGNSNTGGNNAYSTNVQLVSVSPFGNGAQNFNIGNPNLQWESVINKNIGFDATLFNRIVELTVDVYSKVSTKMLLQPKVPVYSGLNSGNTYNPVQPPVTNGGQMTNTGIDISLTTNNIKNNNLMWKTTVVFSHYKNILNDNGGVPIKAFREYGNAIQITNTESGSSVGSFYGLVSDGLFRSQEELNAFGSANSNNQLAVGPTGIWLGDIRYKDLNGDGVINSLDYTAIGSPIPKFTYGMTNNLSYKGFDLTVFITGSQGAKILNYTRRLTEGLYNSYLNQSTAVLDRYTPNNTSASVPRYNQWNDNNRRLSDRYVEDGSYLRIQNVTIAYNIPTSIIRRAKLTSARIYISGQNLKTFTKYTGYDPEIGAYNNSIANMNIDDGHYPNPRTFTIGGNFVF